MNFYLAQKEETRCWKEILINVIGYTYVKMWGFGVCGKFKLDFYFRDSLKEFKGAYMHGAV